MYCHNCGEKLVVNAKFCGNCGTKVISQHHPQKPSSDTSNLSKTLKTEISALPIVTLIGDTLKGASGLSDLQEKLAADQKNPLLWMFYYEGFITYQKMNKGVNVARIIYNPVGFAVSKGVASGLNAMDDDFEAFDPRKCLSTALALCMEKINKKEVSSTDLMITGKVLFYMGINEESAEQQEAFYLKAIKYLTSAIQVEKNNHYIAEYFFYLSQVYQMAGQEKLQYRALNMSRKLGFTPALELLIKYLKDHGMTDEKIDVMVLQQPKENIQQFTFTYRPDTTNRIENSLKFAYQEQSKKLKNTSERIKNFFS
ncbi:zinc ribbon domain-containing protein [Oceanobacillus salinisoli]|uniref:zinc ribbon domain-containing protein n=1 Tax=Oceanobacillus salinisoli TaxID=2678611 RepID=UPI0012E23745|nr:zinc ribbon domain-containing protein [Oceanobacillus salinisoli]